MLVAEFFYYLYRVLHIIKWYIRHNAMTEVKYETFLALHPIKQTVDPFFYHLFIGIQNMRIKVALYGYTGR